MSQAQKSTKRERFSVLKKIPSLFSQLTTNHLLYTLLLISFFLIGYLVGRIQSLEEKLGIQKVNAAAQSGQSPQQVEVSLGRLEPIGDKNAPVKIVEFSDFQCLYCRKFWKDTHPQLIKEYLDTGKAVLYYRHYPLSFHPQAQVSAEAAECANEQDKFIEYHDTMFEEQSKLGDGTIEYTIDDLKKWAAKIKLDTKKFNECLDSGKFKDNVSEDFNDGTNLGVKGTPALFINGIALVGAQPFESIKAVIEEELKK